LEPPLDQAPQLQESQGFGLRVAFVFRDGRWSAMPHRVDNQDELAKLVAKSPSQVSWTIALQGKRLGQLSSVRPSGCSEYAHIGLEDLAAGSKPPAIKEGAAAFATWMGAGRYRPLLAVS